MIVKKCIVLDLDNTLWGGIVGEDGQDNLLLSVDGPGAAYVAFQQALKDLYDRGIILAINSRNNFDEAMNVIKNHPDMILKENYFVATRINWQDKATNLLELSQEINIGLDSMVFLDDDATNRSVVKSILPEVEVPELPANPEEYAKFLIDLPFFPSSVLTDEDKMRGNMYVTERLRQTSARSFENIDEFLKSLNLELQIFIDDDKAISRLSQLTEKTNQFNINKHPLTEDELFELIRSPGHRVIHGRLVDRFGDYGIVILAILFETEKYLHIDQLLMSCRVIGKGVEEAFLSVIFRLASDQDVDRLIINFSANDRNIPAQDFVNKYFSDKQLSLTGKINFPLWIKIKYE